MSKKLIYLIAATAVLRAVVAASLELSNDEVYYFLYALDLQSNYFDHPPGVGILIRLFTTNLSFTSELFVRLGAIVCTGIGTYLAYQLGLVLKNERTGWYSAIIYNTSIYTSVIAGTFIIPDSPQVVFWMASMLVMFRIINNSQKDEKITLTSWIALGIFTGLCVMCKVHGIFLWFGFGLFILIYQRNLLKEPGLYVAAIVTVITISPILIWNIQNDFVTYKFHSERVAIQESPFHFDYFVQTLGGQLIYNNPINAVIILIALWKLRSLKFLPTVSSRFILLMGLPIIIVVTVMSLFNSLLPHWSGPGFMSLGLLAAAFLDERAGERTGIPNALKASVGLITTAFVAAAILINFYPGTLGYRDREKFGEGDFTLDMYGWKDFGHQFADWITDEKKVSNLSKDITIVSHKWFPAAHLDYYVALPNSLPLLGVGKATDLHQYFWLNRSRKQLNIGDDALFIVPSNYTVNLDHVINPYFASSERIKTFESYRSGELVRYFDIYLLRSYNGTDEVRVKSAE